MSAVLRVVDTGLAPARWNVAATAALTELHRSGRIGDTLRFHRYARAVLVGRHQNVDDVADAAACRRRGVEIARRVTGGGAVYMAPEVLAWDIVLARRAFPGGLDAAAAAIGGALAAGLARLGVAARHRPPGDLVVAGRKIAGAGGYFDGGTLVYQGSLLIDVDFAEMACVLRFAAPPQPPLQERLVTLRAWLRRMPPRAAVMRALVAGAQDGLRCSACAGALSEEERRLADALLADEIGTEAFVAGTGAQAARVPA
jgi:lipoate-protein ligase A